MRALAVSDRLPDITRPDVGVVVVSECPVVRPDRQRATAELLLAAWERLPWPSDLLSLSTFLSSDGETVLSYAQWRASAAKPELREICGAARASGIEDAKGTAEPTGPLAYRLYGSAVSERVPLPGCVVVVSMALDRPSKSRQRQWVDAVFDAMVADTDPPPGRLSGHFHLGTDDLHVLVYTEWTSEEAHVLATERCGALGSPEWQHVQAFYGPTSAGFKRYHLLRSLAPA